MKIIILGAGQVGGTLAENLVGENNDITIVDTNPDQLRQLQDKFDLRAIQGHGSHPRVLRDTRAEDADMLVAVKAYYGGPLVGNALSSLREHMSHIETRVAEIFRQDRPIRPQGSSIIEAGDEVFFVVASQHIRSVMSEMQRLEKPYKRIMIVGGGNTAGKKLQREVDRALSGTRRGAGRKAA